MFQFPPSSQAVAASEWFAPKQDSFARLLQDDRHGGQAVVRGDFLLRMGLIGFPIRLFMTRMQVEEGVSSSHLLW